MSVQPLPGFIFLKRPQGGSPCVIRQPVPPPQPAPGVQHAMMARLLTLWLEAIDGRRTAASLAGAPFHPDVLAQIPRHYQKLHGTTRPGSATAVSALRSMHIQPSPVGAKVRLCASALIEGRVRALAATTCRVRSGRSYQWRIETLQVV